jgi:hypothetical protein
VDLKDGCGTEPVARHAAPIPDRDLDRQCLRPREILLLLYALAEREPPALIAGDDYAGYPLVANAQGALAWFVGGLPLLILIAWWWSRRPPRISRIPVLKEVQT